MVWKMVAAAVVVVAAGWGAAHAQSANDLSSPRELPPASFKGQQYVDSRGCVFLRAGLGGRVNWVPRVRADRRQLCGYPPSFGGGAQVAVEDTPRAPAPRVEPAPRVAAAPKAPSQPATGRKPIDTVASITTPPRIRQAPVATTRVQPAPKVAAPAAVQVPRGTGAERVGTTAGTGKIGCYADAPVAERFALRDGGSVVMCTKGDGDLTHARPPRLPGGAAAVAPSGFVEGNARIPNAARSTDSGKAVIISTQDRRPPKGYKQAWDDDRLNPNRGKGTRSGWADQDQVWTREVPARLVEDVERENARKSARQRAAQRATASSDGSGSPGSGIGPDVAATPPTPTPPAGSDGVVQTPPPTGADFPQTQQQKRVVRRVFVSSKSEPSLTAPKKQVAASGKSYVQVGTFGVPSNADDAASRLRSVGLPVARAKTKNGGREFQIVMAGPFKSSADAQAALKSARRAGFADAFMR